MKKTAPAGAVFHCIAEPLSVTVLDYVIVDFAKLCQHPAIHNDGDSMQKSNYTLIAVAVPLILTPAAVRLAKLDQQDFLFGLSSSYCAGFLVGMSLVMLAFALTRIMGNRPK